MTDHERWEPGHIMSPIDSAGRDRTFSEWFIRPLFSYYTIQYLSMRRCRSTTACCFALRYRLSGHLELAYTCCLNWFGTLLHQVCAIVFSVHPIINTKADLLSTPSVSFRLAASLLSGTSAADLSHLLALPSVSLDEVSETLSQALILAENGQDKGTSTWRALGLVLETYRYS